jgi:hypothetical protein
MLIYVYCLLGPLDGSFLSQLTQDDEEDEEDD